MHNACLRGQLLRLYVSRVPKIWVKLEKKGLMKLIIIFSIILIMSNIVVWAYKSFNFNSKHTSGEIIDVYNGVNVYFNGGINQVFGRNLTEDNYNLGLKYQCTEFVKRYYFIVLKHKMPNSYGNAIDFFDKKLFDGDYNSERGLLQYNNPSSVKPAINDILIYRPNLFNRFGHVSIISNIKENEIEIIQQNPGPFGNSRETMTIENHNGMWSINNKRIIGWLRIENIQ